MSYSPFSPSGSDAKSWNLTQLHRGGVIADARGEIFSGEYPDESILNLRSSDTLMNSSQRNWSRFNILRQPFAQSAIARLFILLPLQIFNCQLGFKWEGGFIKTELICKFGKRVKTKFSGVGQIHDRGRRGADEGGVERSFPDLRQRGENFENNPKNTFLAITDLLNSNPYIFSRVRVSSQMMCWRTSCAKLTTPWRRTTLTTSSRRWTRTAAGRWTLTSSRRWWWDEIRRIAHNSRVDVLPWYFVKDSQTACMIRTHKLSSQYKSSMPALSYI